MTNIKKHFGGIAAALVLTVGLGACGSSTETSTPSTTSTKAPATTTTTEDILKTAPQSLKVEALVEVFQDEFPGTSRADALDIAKSACGAIEASGSVIGAMEQIAIDPDIDSTTAGDMAFIMGISIPVYCPKYLAEMNRITGN